MAGHRELVRKYIWRALYGPAGYFNTVDAIYSAPEPLDFERMIAQVHRSLAHA